MTKQISIATMVILFVSLTGLAYPIRNGCGSRRRSARPTGRRPASSSSSNEARAPPERRRTFPRPAQGADHAREVTLESRSGRILLDDVSVEIPAGLRTAVMGLDDDSKLALVCLIPRLIDPKSGRVLIDGRDLREVTLDSVRAQVATVLQADLVFTD